MYDPSLDAKKSKGKELMYRYDGRIEVNGEMVEVKVKDPRVEAKKQGKDLAGRGMRKLRATFYTLEWEVSLFSHSRHHHRLVSFNQ